MQDESQRFNQTNGALDANHVGHKGARWAVTRFGGALYLSLAIDLDIYVKVNPTPAIVSRPTLFKYELVVHYFRKRLGENNVPINILEIFVAPPLVLPPSILLVAASTALHKPLPRP